jgi:predicted nucleotidyltransferase
MDKGSVIETLRLHEPELRAAGIVHLRLFGSVARGEASPESDVDLMADPIVRSASPLLAWRTWKTSLPTFSASRSISLLRIR